MNVVLEAILSPVAFFRPRLFDLNLDVTLFKDGSFYPGVCGRRIAVVLAINSVAGVYSASI